LRLDGLRAIAFLAVFVHHAMGVPVAWVGVDLFFVLSGFLITGILVRERGSPHYFRTFYTRRVLRIFPPYYLFLILSLVLLGSTFVRQSWWYFLYLSNVRDALMPPFVSWLSPMWSLAVEEQFYLIWPLVVALTPRRRLLWVCLVLILLAPGIRAVVTHFSSNFRPVYSLLFTRMDLLAAGGALAILRKDQAPAFRILTRLGPLVAVGAGTMFLALAIFFRSFRTSANSMIFNTVGYTLILVFVTAVLATVLGLKKGPVLKGLTNRTVVFLGTISYTMYLIHKLVLAIAQHDIENVWLNTIAALLVTIIWAGLSWFLLEKPISRLKENIIPYLVHSD